MIFGIKLDFQSYFNYATEFALKFRLVFASVFAIFISVQLYSSVNSILFPDIDFKASTVVNTSQQYVALNSDPFSSAKASAINQSIANSSKSNKKGPETDLNIKLYGIVKSKEENVAIIGLPNEKQRSYKIGDKISGNLVVESIDDTFVNLRRNGKLESLSFAEVIKNKGFGHFRLTKNISKILYLEGFIQAGFNDFLFVDYTNIRVLFKKNFQSFFKRICRRMILFK